MDKTALKGLLKDFQTKVDGALLRNQEPQELSSRVTQRNLDDMRRVPVQIQKAVAQMSELKAEHEELLKKIQSE